MTRIVNVAYFVHFVDCVDEVDSVAERNVGRKSEAAKSPRFS